MHATLPVVLLYFPVTHVLHVPPSGPVYPTLHVHAALAELPLGELEPVGHVTQVAATVAATVSEYVPTTQSVHAAAVAPVTPEYLPATQLVHAVAPSTLEYEPGIQFVHCGMLVAPTMLEYLPTAQLVQLNGEVAPTVTEYVPAKQLRHELK